MKLKNANIKSREEAKQRLEAGEVFWSNPESKIYYDFSACLRGESPYRYKHEPLLGFWDLYNYWKVEDTTPWYKNITKPVLCRVWDGNKDESFIVCVHEYRPSFISPFGVGGVGYGYRNAEPLTLEEIKQYILDDNCPN